MLTFERRQITDQIDPLPKRLRVAFAVACAQRLLPCYIRTSADNPTGNPKAATRIVCELWNAVERNTLDPEELQRALVACDAIIPDYEPKYFDGLEYAEDAIVSLSHALRAALGGESDEAMCAAERAYNALDEYINQKFRIDINAPGAQSRIDSFPIIQAELARQQADLADLRAAAKNPGSEAAVIARIKHRAEHDAASFFG